MTTPTTIEAKLRQAKPVLQDKYSVDKIGYFGSFACGDYREDSDVDILVIFHRTSGRNF